MRKIYILLLLSFFTIRSYSQEAAEDIIQQAIAHLNTSKGIKASYDATTKVNSNEENHSCGIIYIEKEKFKLESETTITWFNGTTLWSYVIHNNEVNISEPEEEELIQLNPYYLLHHYNDFYTVVLKGVKRYKNQETYLLHLTPLQKEENSFSMIQVYLNNKNFQPVCIKTIMTTGESTTIEIDHYQIKQKYKKHFFTFSHKKYSKVELIDLR
jgi:outer membrane lipoprotein-sorting protein